MNKQVKILAMLGNEPFFKKSSHGNPMRLFILDSEGKFNEDGDNQFYILKIKGEGHHEGKTIIHIMFAAPMEPFGMMPISTITYEIKDNMIVPGQVEISHIVPFLDDDDQMTFSFYLLTHMTQVEDYNEIPWTDMKDSPISPNAPEEVETQR